jgi:O-antigen/teichoic acid export membrane protein
MLLWGLPVIPASFATMALAFSDKIVLRFIVGLEDAGIYSMGTKIAGAIVLVLTAFRFAWGPYMFELGRDTATANRTYPKVLLPLLALLGVCIVALNSLTPELFDIFVGKEYQAARMVIFPVSFAYLFDAMSLFFGAGLQTRDKTIFMPAVTGFAAIINIALNFALIPKFGFMGAAWAVVLSYFALAFMSYRVGNKFMEVKYPWTRIALLLLITILGLVGAWQLKPLLSRIGVIIASAALLYYFSGTNLKGLFTIKPPENPQTEFSPLQE